MKYKTLFRLAIKVIGVWMLIEGAVVLVYSVAQGLATFMQMQGAGATFPVAYIVVAPLQGLLKLGIGLYLFFGGKWIVDRAIPGNRSYCHECGYELRSLTGDECPECGMPFKPSQPAA